MYIHDKTLCSLYNYIYDIFGGKGENAAQSNIKTQALTLKGCPRLPNMQRGKKEIKRKEAQETQWKVSKERH